MRKLIPLSILGLLVVLFLGISSVNADIQVTLNDANATEFNDATPPINVTVIGNGTAYLCNVTMGGTQVATDQTLVNNTATQITASTLTTGSWYVTNATCYNVTSGINSSSDKTFQINGRPAVSTVTESTASVVPKGGTFTFTVAWTDANATGTDGVRMYACKTNAFSGGSCTGGQWCSNTTYEADNNSDCSYSTPYDGTSGPKNYWVFLRDDNSYDSSSGTSGSFEVGGSTYDYGGDEDLHGENFKIVDKLKGLSDRDVAIGVFIIIAVIIGIVYFTRPKRGGE